MKFVLNLILLQFFHFVLNKSLVNGQSLPAKLICLYRMSSRTDSTSKVMTEEVTQLAITDSTSEFRSLARYKGDSLANEYKQYGFNAAALNEGMNRAATLPKVKFDGIIIKKLNTNECFYYGLIDKVLYYYKDENYSQNWLIVPETAIINGYKCQKALTLLGGRKYSAWFTRQIPVSNGPYKFGGLPGLIVSISDATNSYKFELMQVYHPTKNYYVLPPGKVLYLKQTAKYTSKQQYYTAYVNYRNNFIENSVAGGMMKFENEASLRQFYKEKVRHRNNPIELNYKK